MSQDAAWFRTVRIAGDDGIQWIEFQGAVSHGEAHEPVRVIGTARDITDRKMLEQKLAAAEKFESIGVMAAGLAHDFNNLLVSVIGSASFAKESLPTDHTAIPFLDDVIAAGERAASLTAQMLAYSGQGLNPREKVDVSRIASEAVSSIEGKLRPNIRIEQYAEPGVTIAGDAAQIRQVIVNLLTNAREAMDGTESGTITVRTNIRQIDESYIQGVLRSADITPGAFAAIEVKDTGCGIPSDIRDKIFEPFFTTKFAGRGMGLAAVAGTVRAHGGAIHITTAPGQGTTVLVLVPADSRATDKPKQPVSTGDHTVLIVDDEESVVTLGSAYLSRHGYRVLGAHRGEEALAIIEKGEPVSLVLLDLTMPGIGGKETLTRLRRIAPTVPVIISSGYSKNDVMSKIEAAEITGFLQKPYRPQTLLQKITEVVEGPMRRA